MADDWTVLTLACQECNRVVDWDRFNQIDYTYQRAHSRDLRAVGRVGILPRNATASGSQHRNFA